MIKAHCFTKEWIDNFRKEREFSRINPPVLEKMIQALYLLQLLSKTTLEFVFKGGTSLILLLKNVNRFSVDIDIITKHSQEEIEKYLDDIVESSHFKKWTLDERRSYQPGVPKAHYELEYESNINKSSSYILLDLLFEDYHYPEIQQLTIATNWIESDEDVKVQLPTVEAIAGDKLTAFAPNTTGIPYGKGKELEIIKQLFDLGHLFDEVENMDVIAKSFNAFAKVEIDYRQLSGGPEIVLNDILETSALISTRGRNIEKSQTSQFKELQSGLTSFNNFMITGSFRIDQAVVASAKTAFLASKIQKEDFTPVEKYINQDVSDWEIGEEDWNFLNRLKRLPDKSAFFYWYRAVELIVQDSVIPYGNRRRSSISAFKTGRDFIKVYFDNKDPYLYTNRKPGKQEVEEMKRLAVQGKGLNTYINKYIRKRFVR